MPFCFFPEAVRICIAFSEYICTMQQQAWWHKNSVMVPVALSFYALVFILCSLLSEGAYGGGDSWMHYLFAKYAFKHPENYMDQWAKPVFTLIASPFAWFGFGGIKLFNIACALFTAYLSYRIIKEHVEADAWLSIVFVCSVPIYFVCVYSGLTEILFALFLVAGIFLYQGFHERYACLLISFLPFIRSEGFLMIPVFAFATLYYRQWKATPLLAVGTVLFTIIGYFYAHDWKWVFSTNPYLIAGNVYGKGSLLNFVGANENIAGLPMVILILSTALIFFRQFRHNFHHRMLHIRFVLIFGCIATYFIAHSIFWRLGIFGSLGLIRVMAGIGPLIGLTAFYAYDYWRQRTWARGKVFQYAAWLLVPVIMVIPRKQFAIPNRMSSFEQIQYNSCRWILDNNLQHNYLYYFDPFVSHLLGVDPFDANTHDVLIYKDNALRIRKDALVIWDSNFCPQEGHVPLQWMDTCKDLTLLHEEREPKKPGDTSPEKFIRIYKANAAVEFINMPVP